MFSGIIEEIGRVISYDKSTMVIEAKKVLSDFKSKKNILIFGSGGVGKSAIVSANEIFKNKNIFVYNRNYNKVFKFISKVKNKKIKILKDINLISKISNVDLIINATSIGFNLWQKNKKGFFNLSFFSPLEKVKNIISVKNKNLNIFLKKNSDLINENLINTKNFFKKNSNCSVFDIVYDPRKTVLIKIANKFSNKNINGLEMNLDQAIFAFSIVNKIQNKKLLKKIMINK